MDKEQEIPEDFELPEGMTSLGHFFTYSKMYANYMKQFKDPWADPVRLACLVDSLFVMFGKLYPDGDGSDSPTFQSLLPGGECHVCFTDEIEFETDLKPGEVVTKYEVSSRRLLVIAGAVEGETLEEKNRRRLALQKEFWPTVQKAMHDMMVEMVGAIPAAAQERFMEQNPAASHQHVKPSTEDK